MTSAAKHTAAVPQWKDTTSYSQGRDRKPTCWSIDFGGMHLSVLTGHLYNPDNWVVHCEPWFNAKQIAPKSTDTATAQRLAIELVAEKLRVASATLARCSSQVEEG
jgi:hypothetical protein